MLSIIVPIYNGSEYLERCIESILIQEYIDLEIICVDDGSNDTTIQLLNQLCLRDSRIRIIHKEKNEGLVAARKTGVNVAKGEYIAYVDCDDWIELDMFSEMMSVANRYDADIVTSGTVYEGSINKTEYDGFDEGLYEGASLDDIKRHVFFSHKKYKEGIRANLVNKIYKADLIRSIQNDVPDSILYGEDRICSLKCVLETKSLYILNKAYYHYVVHEHSMSSGGNLFFLDEIGLLYRELLKLIQGTIYEEDLKRQCGIYIVQLLMRGINENLGILPEDLLWLHPSWLKEIPCGSKVVLYGCGRRGRTYYRQIRNCTEQDISVVAWLDRNYRNIVDTPVEVYAPEMVCEFDYDYIIVSIEDDKIYKEVVEWLKELGVELSKIIRPMPIDAFWEFAESGGIFV